MTGLGADVGQADVAQLFSDFDEVPSFLSKSELGVAFVILKDMATAAVAVQKSGSKIKDKTVSVSLASSRHESEMASFLTGMNPDVKILESLLKGLHSEDLNRLLSRFATRVDNPNGSVSQLVASASGTSVQELDSFPKIPNFSGDNGTEEVSYSHWKYEVRCLLLDYPERAIVMAIRHSVRDTAAALLRCLDKSIGVNGILSRFDDAFKCCLSKDQLFPLFYSAQQEVDEKVAVWGCRLEDILSQNP